MIAVSQIIGRNIHRRTTGGNVLWINPEADDSWRALKPTCTELKLFSQDFTCFTFLKRTGANVEFSAFPQHGEKKYDWVIINLPRQKALLAMMLDCAASLLASGGVLWLAGENKAGIKSADKLLKMHFQQVRKLDSARHCSLFEASVRLNQDVFNALHYRQKWVLNCSGCGIDVVSYPGVFAHGRLDEGTALLLEALSSLNLQGDVMDFGCGAGLVGACIAHHHEHTRVTLLDSSALALRASRETLEENQLSGLVLASDGLSGIDSQFDTIVSNPPIHVGVRTDNHLGMQLLESVQEHLRPGGELILVANVHLPYENWLSMRFKGHRELAANKDYKVIAARKLPK